MRGHRRREREGGLLESGCLIKKKIYLLMNNNNNNFNCSENIENSQTCRHRMPVKKLVKYRCSADTKLITVSSLSSTKVGDLVLFHLISLFLLSDVTISFVMEIKNPE